MQKVVIEEIASSVVSPANGYTKHSTDSSKKIICLSTCKLQDLPHIPLSTVLECLRDDEYGDARFFSLVFDGLCVYDYLEHTWYLWEGHYWIRDNGQTVSHLVSGFLSSLYIRASAEINLLIKSAAKNKDGDEEEKDTTEQKGLKLQKKALLQRAEMLKKISRVRNILEFAKSNRALHVPHRLDGKEVVIAWDKNPWLLGTRDGVLNLQTGKLNDGNPLDFIRTVIPTKWKGINEPCPRFELFLQEIFSDREEKARDELVHFLHKSLGYGITGLTVVHMILALIGEQGRNGKDTLIKRLLSVLGRSIAGPVAKELFISSKFGASPGSATPHVMSLQGKRIAWASETDKGESFNVGALKEYSGGGELRGRNLRENEQTFESSHLLMLLTNNKPHADATDKAFWERLCPIMFNVRYVNNPDPNNPLEHKPDINLSITLEAENSGILAWLVRGCLLWQKEGLDIPQEILKERANYRADEDTIGRFVKECCVLRPVCHESGGVLYKEYKEWAIENNLKPINSIAFGRDMEKRFRKTNPKNVKTYHGVGLRSNQQYQLYAQEDDERVEEEKDNQSPSQTPDTSPVQQTSDTQQNERPTQLDYNTQVLHAIYKAKTMAHVQIIGLYKFDNVQYHHSFKELESKSLVECKNDVVPIITEQGVQLLQSLGLASSSNGDFL